ncbi:hypothetical protein BpHYR1_032829 [Brachionus plicatilis]|uniref:Uncharacterized protein n=1 Tax=Brachionus plicatilis TaxID=10195 RepID=A0A3M7QN70_BRAPC|nr:hypothetical protein BpHYR1_032829 [Brachionus plicatilis]
MKILFEQRWIFGLELWFFSYHTHFDDIFHCNTFMKKIFAIKTFLVLLKDPGFSYFCKNFNI